MSFFFISGLIFRISGSPFDLINTVHSISNQYVPIIETELPEAGNKTVFKDNLSLLSIECGASKYTQRPHRIILSSVSIEMNYPACTLTNSQNLPLEYLPQVMNGTQIELLIPGDVQFTRNSNQIQKGVVEGRFYYVSIFSGALTIFSPDQNTLSNQTVQTNIISRNHHGILISSPVDTDRPFIFNPQIFFPDTI